MAGTSVSSTCTPACSWNTCRSACWTSRAFDDTGCTRLMSRRSGGGSMPSADTARCPRSVAACRAAARAPRGFPASPATAPGRTPAPPSPAERCARPGCRSTASRSACGRRQQMAQSRRPSGAMQQQRVQFSAVVVEHRGQADRGARHQLSMRRSLKASIVDCRRAPRTSSVKSSTAWAARRSSSSTRSPASAMKPPG